VALDRNLSAIIPSYTCLLSCRVAGNAFCPYDLEVVANKANLQGEFFIVSSVGMLQVEQGGRTEFRELRAWMRDRTNFNLISQIPAFKLHLSRQAFSLWLQVMHQNSQNTRLMAKRGKISR
jgi:hypothetical protein